MGIGMVCDVQDQGGLEFPLLNGLSVDWTPQTCGDLWWWPSERAKRAKKIMATPEVATPDTVWAKKKRHSAHTRAAERPVLWPAETNRSLSTAVHKGAANHCPRRLFFSISRPEGAALSPFLKNMKQKITAAIPLSSQCISIHSQCTVNVQ